MGHRDTASDRLRAIQWLSGTIEDAGETIIRKWSFVYHTGKDTLVSY